MVHQYRDYGSTGRRMLPPQHRQAAAPPADSRPWAGAREAPGIVTADRDRLLMMVVAMQDTQQLGSLQRERQRLMGQQGQAQARLQAGQEALDSASADVAAAKRELAGLHAADKAGRCADPAACVPRPLP